MSLINVGPAGARILEVSCSRDASLLKRANNVLSETRDEIWQSSEGLPQSFVISLMEVNQPYRNLCGVAFHLWHDYDTNPKEVELWVASSLTSEFLHWTNFHLKRKAGDQLFQISHLPSSYTILKIVIVDTYGDYETYLNQIKLLVEPIDHKGFLPLSVEDLEWRDSHKQRTIESTHTERRQAVYAPEQFRQFSSASKAINKQREQSDGLMEKIESLGRKVDILDVKLDAGFSHIGRTIETHVKMALKKQEKRQTELLGLLQELKEKLSLRAEKVRRLKQKRKKIVERVE